MSRSAWDLTGVHHLHGPYIFAIKFTLLYRTYILLFNLNHSDPYFYSCLDRTFQPRLGWGQPLRHSGLWSIRAVAARKLGAANGSIFVDEHETSSYIKFLFQNIEILSETHPGQEFVGGDGGWKREEKVNYYIGPFPVQPPNTLSCNRLSQVPWHEWSDQAFWVFFFFFLFLPTRSFPLFLALTEL